MAFNPRKTPDFRGLSITGSSDAAKLTQLLALLATLGLTINTPTGVGDTFNRADGVMGSTDTTNVAAWVVGAGGGWAIASNVAHFSGGSDTVLCVNSGVYDNLAIQFTLKAITGSFPVTFFARGSSATSFVKVYRDNPNGQWIAQDSATGVPSNVAKSTAAPQVNDVLKLAVQGTTLTLFSNGTQLCQWTGYSFHNTTADTFQGVIGSGGVALSVDDFSVAAYP